LYVQFSYASFGDEYYYFKFQQKDTLAWVKKSSIREDFENRNSNRFRRIFPVEDRGRQEKYINLLTQTFNIFMSGRAPAMAKEIQRMYSNKLRVQYLNALIYRILYIYIYTQPQSTLHAF